MEIIVGIGNQSIIITITIGIRFNSSYTCRSYIRVTCIVYTNSKIGIHFYDDFFLLKKYVRKVHSEINVYTCINFIVFIIKK